MLIDSNHLTNAEILSLHLAHIIITVGFKEITKI